MKKQKEFNDLIKIEWKTLEEIKQNIFKELKKDDKHKSKF